MNSRAFRLIGTLRGAVGAGLAASIAATAFVVKAHSEYPGQSENAGCKRSASFGGVNPIKPWDFNWDGLDPGQGGKIWSDKEGKGKTSKARRNIILIRHGQYNTDGCEDCHHTLTPLGEEQAAFAGKKLANMKIQFTSIVSSSMTRAMQTACIIRQQLSNQKAIVLEEPDPLIAEGAPCIPEPPYRNLQVWNPLQRDVLVESSRIEAGFRKYFHRACPSQEEDSWEIIVCHGNVIRYFALRALQFPPEGWMRISVDHCSMTRFIILPSGEVILTGLGDSGHIPFEKVTVA